MTLRVAILGTGGMANGHAEAFTKIPGVQIAAGIDTNPGRLADFNARHRIEIGFTSLEEALAWGRFDAISNVTPDPVHYPTTLRIIDAGKHILCEKPLATNAAHATRMAEAAGQAGLVNMVNLSYREVPAVIQAAAMVAAGEIGEVRHFEASYLQSWLTQPAWGDWREGEMWLWRLSTGHGSMGVLGDVGIHILDFATHVAGQGVADVSCRLTTFPKAEEDRIGDYTLDANDSAVMHLALTGGATGVVHASRFASGHINDLRLRIHGTLGGLDVRFEAGQSLLRACIGPDLRAARWVDIPCPAVPRNYERFVAGVRSGQPARPDFARGAELQRIIDAAIASDARGGASVPA